MASYERYKEYASLTAAELAAVNNIFPEGQLVVEADTGKMKVGDGTTAYNSLPYGPTTLSSLTLPNGTVNGVLYLNGSKVVTSGSALTFDGTNLAIGASPSFYGGQVATAGSIAITGGNLLKLWNTGGTGVGGISSPGTDTIAFGLGGSFTEAMRLDSTGLGIGTTPTAKLDVQTTGQEIANLASSNANGGYMTLGRVGALSIIGSYLAASGGGVVLPSADALYFRSSNGIGFGSGGAAPTAFLDTSGNLGLGVTPSAVSISDRVLQVRNFLFDDNTNGYGILRYNNYFNGTNDVYLNTGAVSAFQMQGNAFKWYQAASGNAGDPISFTQAMTLDASGNLGVGITNPSVKLHVSGTGDQKIYISTFTSGSPELQFRAEGVNGGAITYDRGNQTLRLSNAGVVSAYASTSGNFVIGTAALATTATDGFLYVPTCAGTPTGTPTTQTGTAPIVVDTTNNKLYFYSGGQWRDAGP